MIFVEASTRTTPRSLMNKILKAMPENQRMIFERRVTTSVDLDRPNNSNHAYRDLARFQVCELARKMNVQVNFKK